MAKKDVLYGSNGGNVASATKKEDKKMKKIEYNFFYNGKAILKEEIVREFGKNWKKKFVRDQWGNWAHGYYRACQR